MTKDEILARFDALGIAPPDGASKEDLERTYHEILANLHRERPAHYDKLSATEKSAARAIAENAAGYDQVVVDVETGEIRTVTGGES